MTEKIFVLLLLTTVSMIQLPHQIPLRIVKINDTITLRCPGIKRWTFQYWYKQSPGRMLQQVSSSSLDKTVLQGQFNNSRFIVNLSASDNNLTIRNINKDDEATYFCGKRSSLSVEYNKGTYVIVNESDHERTIHQTLVPVSRPVPLGDPVTLLCWVLSESREDGDQCSAGSKVFWFRSNESHPGVVSSHWHRSRGCETEAGSGPQRCVYSLYKDSVLSSDAGMYYCAVAACGEIVFGKGAKLEISQKLDPLVIVPWLLLVCCVIMIVILICTNQGTLNISSHCGHDQTAVNQSSNQTTGPDSTYQSLQPATMNQDTYDVMTPSTTKPHKKRQQHAGAHTTGPDSTYQILQPATINQDTYDVMTPSTAQPHKKRQQRGRR